MKKFCLLPCFILVLLLNDITATESEVDADDDSEDEANLRRRTLLRRIAIASETERQSKSRGGAQSLIPRPGNYQPTYPKRPNIINFDAPTSCGIRSVSSMTYDRKPKILDGIEADYGAYPWQVSIEMRGKSTGEKWTHICGGSLISRHHILTAAHCFRDTLSDYRVIVGNHYLNKTDVSEQVFLINPGDYTNHRRFGYQSEFDNDISFVRLRSPDDRGVQFDSYVHPICLPPDEGVSLQAGLRCHVSGWGTQDKKRAHKVSPILRVAEVPLQSQRECLKAYHDDDDDLRENYLRRLYPSYRPTVITDGNFCAGGDGPDACSGDSGGPLACSLPGQPDKFFLAGIVSWGKECGSKTHPGIYTKVSHYLRWIQNEIDLSRPELKRYH